MISGKMRLKVVLAVAALLMTVAAGAWAQDGDVPKPCSSSEIAQIDFWVGIYTRQK